MSNWLEQTLLALLGLTVLALEVALISIPWVVFGALERWSERRGMVLLKPGTRIDQLARSTPFIPLRWYRGKRGKPLQGPYITRKDFRKLKEMKQ